MFPQNWHTCRGKYFLPYTSEKKQKSYLYKELIISFSIVQEGSKGQSKDRWKRQLPIESLFPTKGYANPFGEPFQWL